MIQISNTVAIAESEIELLPIRAQGAGGQKVNKTSSAIHLRFDINASSPPDHYKQTLGRQRDQRITADGMVVIKAQQYRTQEQNREDAIARLIDLLKSAVVVRKARRPTRPSKGSVKRRMDSKTRRGKIKADRRKPDF
ncbi:MAG: alternative ribosome rescue aminoacyl-tRNA hydrolase ArfB [Pseudomonadota bacterium]